VVLLCGTPQATIQMKKGGAALLDFPSHIAAGKGTLLWLLTPGQLRAIGSAKR
jgi:phosphohistidine phosphatase SixA